jgi:hypothetical protein
MDKIDSILNGREEYQQLTGQPMDPIPAPSTSNIPTVIRQDVHSSLQSESLSQTILEADVASVSSTAHKPAAGDVQHPSPTSLSHQTAALISTHTHAIQAPESKKVNMPDLDSIFIKYTRTVAMAVSACLWGLFGRLWAWKWRFVTVIALLWTVGMTMETMEAAQVLSRDVLCGPWARPIMKVLGTTHLCLPVPKLPEDPYGSESLARFVVVHLPRLTGLPKGLAKQKAAVGTMSTLVSRDRKLMFPKYGLSMVHLLDSLHDQLEDCWEQALDVQDQSNRAMSQLGLQLQQVASLAEIAVAQIQQRGPLKKNLFRLASRVFYFLPKWSENHFLLETFVRYINETLPSLIEIVEKAEAL